MTEWYGPDRDSHYGEALHAGERGVPQAREVLASLAGNSGQPGIVRASALSLLGRYPGTLSGSGFQQLFQDPNPLVRHSSLQLLERLEPTSRLDLAVPLLSDSVLAVRIEAARVLAGTRDQMTDRQSSQHRQALAEYRDALGVTAERPESHLNLGNLHLNLGELDRAEQEYRTALRLNPDFVPAYANLADQYRAQGRDNDGEELLRQGLARTDHPDLHHTLGLLLVRQQKPSEAIGHLETASRRQPETARYSYVYGVALHSAGRQAEGMNVLKRAQERHPNDPELLSALVSYLAAAGSRREALEYARRLGEISPGNLEVQQLIRSLESER